MPSAARPEIAHDDPFAGPPRLNGARRVGVRPGTELIHPLAVTGARPLRFVVDGLPDGVTVDDDGILRGVAPGLPGVHTLHVRVSNAEGQAEAQVELHVGDRLALTPPMGWSSWNVFRAEVSAEVIVRVAEAMVSSGMRDLGYQYVNIDDHWHAGARNADGTPAANPATFPDGIAPVAARLHELGLKLGIYSDAAHLTCGGCFGGFGYEQIDARAYAEWGVDLLKYDYCHAPPRRREAEPRYEAMGDAVASSGRSIVFNVCEWGFRKPWLWAPDVGASYWRTTGDVFDTFTWPIIGVRSIARRTLRLARFAGPGRWNDPDMLVVGNRGRGLSTGKVQPVEGWKVRPTLWRFRRGLTDEQARTHMSLWAMLAAPLVASHDPATIDEWDLDLLRNPEILAIDQDVLGNQATRLASPRGTWVLTKRLADGARAVSVTNLGRRARSVTLDLAEHGFVHGAEVLDVWTHEHLGVRTRWQVQLPGYATAVYRCDVAARARQGRESNPGE